MNITGIVFTRRRCTHTGGHERNPTVNQGDILTSQREENKPHTVSVEAILLKLSRKLTGTSVIILAGFTKPVAERIMASTRNEKTLPVRCTLSLTDQFKQGRSRSCMIGLRTTPVPITSFPRCPSVQGSIPRPSETLKILLSNIPKPGKLVSINHEHGLCDDPVNSCIFQFRLLPNIIWLVTASTVVNN
ncbi:hypothetical protein EG68_02129 [Paragonimus skrjabini miyazakii]|uniref:Uncharacterized protein n=1 Tax=Paragonimus skrjabini miyazakii TaxID=59628 RepID=A0A8S9YZ62_9TREM|nr:hypothetical protein EG68_02129 [Paragonimus skrjabini miyazakii]